MKKQYGAIRLNLLYAPLQLLSGMINNMYLTSIKKSAFVFRRKVKS